MSILDDMDRARRTGDKRPIFDPRQRLQSAAEQLNQAGSLQARLGVCEAALVALVNVLYATDADQRPANYDDKTGRILVPLPWGSGGWRHWGLRRMEADCLRRVMIGRSGQRKPPCLFFYAVDSRQWYVDYETYPTVNDALCWVRDHGPQLREWHTVVEAYRLAEIARRVA